MSLSAITNDRGFPLGLATSGFSFSRVSYFWSPAFWGGSIGLYRQARLRGALTILAVLLSGLLAAVVGPASAVLMLPRKTVWPQFSTRIWLNGTTNDFWPATLTVKHANPNEQRHAGRPGSDTISAGLPELAMYLAYSKNDDGGFAITTPEQSFPRRVEGAPKVEGVNAEAWSFAPHAPTSLLMTNLWHDPHWYPAKGKPTGRLSAELEAEAAAVRTVCNPNVQELTNDTRGIAFPNLQEYDTWSPSSTNIDSFTHISPDEVFRGQNKSNVLTESRNMTTLFIQPSQNMTSVTTSLLVLGPRSPDGARIAVACSVDARWNKALHAVVKSEDYGIGNAGNIITARLRARHQRSELDKSTLPTKSGYWRRISAEAAWLELALGYTTLFNFGYPPYDSEVKGPTYRTTALGAILMARLSHLPEKQTPIEYWKNNTNAIESVVSTAFADTISRTGIDRQYIAGGYTPTESVRSCHQISNKYMFCPPPTASEIDQWTPLNFKGFTTGYAYKASKVTDFISIALLAIYILIVIIYLLVSIWSHQSFFCWGTIEELILLAKSSLPNHHERSGHIGDASASPGDVRTDSANDTSTRNGPKVTFEKPPPDDLAHASSGIRPIGTMGLKMRIRAEPRPTQGSKASQVVEAQKKSARSAGLPQMVFTNREAERLQRVCPGVVYG
ncbi:MAG: hypothetical protein Q9218_002869 [Villophora microphyllina]